MWQILEVLENSSVAIWIREAPTILAYPTVLALHAIGMALLVGLSGMIALRILGFAAMLPLAPMSKFYPLIYLSFWVNATSGVLLLILAPVSFLTNPTFYIKLAAIFCAVVLIRLIRLRVFGSADTAPSAGYKVMAAALLFFWGVALVAGRLTAYSFFTTWQTAVAAVILATILLTVRYAAARLLRSHKPAAEARVSAPGGY
jgi:hypothetical protein